MPDYTVRPATTHDAGALERLAALDSAAPVTFPALLALCEGRAVAALELDTGRADADPFTPTTDAVALLALRRAQLARAAREDGRRRRAWRSVAVRLAAR